MILTVLTDRQKQPVKINHSIDVRCHTCFTGEHEGVRSSCAERCHSGHNTEYAGILNAFCDCGLKSRLIYCKIGEECTFDLHGKIGKQQKWYQCHTCWGDNSSFGCCELCAEECHKGHKLIQNGVKERAVCDCGDNKHTSRVCTYHVTGGQQVYFQPFYSCSWCFPRPSDGYTYGSCYQCMKTCHAGHPTVYLGVIKVFCDCGLKCCSISCKIANP